LGELSHKNTTLVVGIGRSGTTLLASVINYHKTCRDIFEPLHPTEGIELRKEFPNGRYLRPDEPNATLQDALLPMLTGEFQNVFANQFNTVHHNQKRITKSIRLAFALKWIRLNFPDLPIVYISRHPCAVVTSQINQRWGNAKIILDRLISQEQLVTDHLAPFTDGMKQAKNEFQRLIFIWCATHYVLLRQFQPGEIHWVLYEQLVADPKTAIRALFNFLERPFDETLALEALQKPSAVTQEKSKPRIADLSILRKWEKDVTRRQLAWTLEQLQWFGLDGLYSADPLPNVELANTLLTDPARPQPGQQPENHWLRKSAKALFNRFSR